MAKNEDFLNLINENQGILHSICKVYTNNSIDHEDLFQEMMTQLWRGYENFKGEAKITTWIYRVSLYTAITHIKKIIRERDTLKDFNTVIHELPKTEETDEELLFRSIKMLDSSDRAFILLYLEDKSYKEMADILGLTESNVGVRLNRIKTKLKKIMS